LPIQHPDVGASKKEPGGLRTPGEISCEVDDKFALIDKKLRKSGALLEKETTKDKLGTIA